MVIFCKKTKTYRATLTCSLVISLYRSTVYFARKRTPRQDNKIASFSNRVGRTEQHIVVDGMAPSAVEFCSFCSLVNAKELLGLLYLASSFVQVIVYHHFNERFTVFCLSPSKTSISWK